MPDFLLELYLKFTSSWTITKKKNHEKKNQNLDLPISYNWSVINAYKQLL